MGTIVGAFFFLLETLFEAYILILLLRIILQRFGLSQHNPIHQFLMALTEKPIKPLRGFLKPWKQLDTAAIALLLCICLLKLIVVIGLKTFSLPALHGLLVWSLGELIGQALRIFFYGILIQVVLSWLSPFSGHPLNEVLFRLTEPLLSPVRRFFPLIAGFDITPIPVMIGLQLLIMLISNPIMNVGISLAMR